MLAASALNSQPAALPAGNGYGIEPWLMVGSPPTWLATLTPGSGPPVKFPYSADMPPALATTSEANQNMYRYWNYRNRLRNEFMLINTDAGGCLPAEDVINLGIDTSGYDHGKFGHWGDSTVKLGWYIGVLATEIYMLSHPREFPGYGGGNDMQNAQIELFCALLAVERLDRFAEETMWSTHYIRAVLHLLGTEFSWYRWPNQPGFFIRDDVTRPRIEELGMYDSENRRPIHVRSDALPYGGIAELWPDPITLPSIPEARVMKEMSQDQAIHLLMGLSLVNRLVPAELAYNIMNFRLFAKNKARHIVRYVGKHPSWTIYEPVNPKTRHLGLWKGVGIPYFDPFHPTDPSDPLVKVARGASALVYSEGFSQAGFWIFGSRTDVNPLASVFWYGLPAGTWTMESLYHTITVFNGGSDQGSMADNIHMMMALGAAGNGWGDATPNFLELLQGWQDFHLYTLLNSVLFHRGRLYVWTERQIEDMLRKAPYGGTHDGHGDIIDGWGSHNRFITDKTDHNGGKMPIPTEFNGLDYMLLNNLFYIAKPEKFKNVFAGDWTMPGASVNSANALAANAGAGSTLPPPIRPALAALVAPNWPDGIEVHSQPIGYGYQGMPTVLNRCNWNAGVEIPITVEWEDLGGDRDSTAIVIDRHPAIGFITVTGTKNQFVFHGAFWDRWLWEDTAGFLLVDREYNTFRFDVPLVYPGAIREAPRVGHVLSGVDLVVDLWGELFGVVIPLTGRIEADFTIYPVDVNCWPWKTAEWFISGLDNVLAWKTSANNLHVRIHITIFDLLIRHHGSVTITALSSAGGPPTIYTIPLDW